MFRGRSVTIRLWSVVPISALLVSSRLASAVTVTMSSRPPTESVTSRFTAWATPTLNPSRDCEVKPSFLNVIV
jgi:hypothetical protein